MELLPFGPMAGLGPEFIRDACYRFHLDDGLLRAAICYAGGEPAGFVAYTERSRTFHRASLRRHLLAAAWLAMKAVLLEPARWRALVLTLRTLRGRRAEPPAQEPLGEVVCIAVRPRFAAAAFTRAAAVSVAESLVRYAFDEVKRAGATALRMLVDEDNKAPLFLYHRLGARFSRYEGSPVPTVEVWFDLTARPEAGSPSSPAR
jgi:ribosomal protein S18 acetylase RimI-like enzyme